MSDAYRISRSAAADGGATGANLTDNGGYCVKDEGINICSLNVHNTSIPLGVILTAGDSTGGVVTIVTHGPAMARAGAAITPGTDFFLEADATGRVIPAAGTAGARTNIIGYVIAERGVVKAAGEELLIYVSPSPIYTTAG